MALRLGKSLTNEQLECDHDDGKCDGCSIRLDLIKALNEAAGKVHTCGKENGVLSDEELMYLGNKLHVVTKKNDVEKLENVIASGAPINALDADMCTPAWVAAKLNYALLLKAILAHADANMNQPDKLKRTPLYIAACENNLDALLVLIDVGAEIDAPDFDKKSPVFIAAQKNHTKVLKLIMGVGADINAPNKKKESPVFIAAQENNAAALKVLLCEGDECSACCVGNYKLMHGMAVCNLCSMIKRGAADINAPNEHSESPVYTAAKKENMDTLRILIAAGADLNAPNEKGITPLIAAAEEGKASALEALIEARCDIEGQDKNGQSPLFAQRKTTESDTHTCC